MEAIKVLVGAIVFIAAPIAIVYIVNLADTLVEKYRRKKHPEWYKYWDEALGLSLARGAEYNKRKENFDFKFKLYSDGLLDGECTNEYYEKKMRELVVKYQQLCEWYQATEKEIRELLVKADLYAKEHDLMWGILYDTKSK